jgi:hypothetical protein
VPRPNQVCVCARLICQKGRSSDFRSGKSVSSSTMVEVAIHSNTKIQKQLRQHCSRSCQVHQLEPPFWYTACLEEATSGDDIPAWGMGIRSHGTTRADPVSDAGDDSRSLAVLLHCGSPTRSLPSHASGATGQSPLLRP